MIKKVFVFNIALICSLILKGQNPFIDSICCDSLDVVIKNIKTDIPFIHSIYRNDSLLIICCEPDFYVFSDKEQTFNKYHLIYSSFFAVDCIQQISIVLKDNTNVTFLPFITAFDYMCPIEDAVFDKDFYVLNIDYGKIIGFPLLDNLSVYKKRNDVSEMKSIVVKRVVNAYKFKKGKGIKESTD
ncbi:hypothetical protein [Bacteroides sp. 519]|uniref:hypothetical protein n=1 Tax=Bacteroides sp. 519 TaxID=2302937 RepID=UPI0013D13E6F|nr:hypothetical protein [Bacteroides sp. 519]NDV60170.1 hypothetical protein [Bacteroides sp. 519]